MGDEVKLALLMGRMIDLLRRQPNAVDDQKATLRGLVELCARRSITVRADESDLKVEGRSVPVETPFVPELLTQMHAHGLAELRLSVGAAAIDLMQLLRGLALDAAAYPPGVSLEKRLEEMGAVGVSVVTADRDAASRERRRLRVTDALQAAGILPAPAAEPAASAPGSAKAPGGPQAAAQTAPSELGLVTHAAGAAYDEEVRQLLSASSTLSGAISQLDVQASGPALLRQLDTIQGSITKALDRNRVDQAIDGVVALIQREEAVAGEEAKRQFGVALRRLLAEQYLRRYAPYLLDELYAADVRSILRRAGKDGTRVLIDLVVKAETFAERKTYMGVLRHMDEGVEVIANMLAHREWFVVRNMADLAGELGIEEAVPALGRVVEHEDPRVRRSVAVALAKIGTPATVPFLARVLQDPDPGVRLATFREVGGRGHGALAMPIVSALDGETAGEVRAEYFRALGRIGTPDAVEALRQVAEASGRILGRRSTADRVAAVEGLGLAAPQSPVARGILENLKRDRAKEVREAVLRGLAAAGPASDSSS